MEVRVLVVADELRRVLVHVLAISVRGTGPVRNLEMTIKLEIQNIPHYARVSAYILSVL